MSWYCKYIVPSCWNNHRGIAENSMHKSQYKTGRKGMTASVKTI